jgi:hypothetical protein
MPVDGTVEQAFDGGHLPTSAHQGRFSTSDRTIPVRYTHQPLGGHGLLGALDLNQFRVPEHCGTLDQPCGRGAEHHPARRGHGLHPLRHTHLLTDRGVTAWARTDLTGDHLPGVQPDPQSQIHTIETGHLLRQVDDGGVDVQGGPAGPNGVVLQRHRRPEQCHDAVAGELV